jgi:lipoprotein-anchoring transpeptidase ErfK/SrfK
LALAVAAPTAALAERSVKKKADAPKGPVLAVVSLSQQRIHVYGSGGLLAESRVSTGMAGFRTPPGVFTVLEKRRHHFSNIYDGAPMPYMQRLTWSGIARLARMRATAA